MEGMYLRLFNFWIRLKIYFFIVRKDLKIVFYFIIFVFEIIIKNGFINMIIILYYMFRGKNLGITGDNIVVFCYLEIKC